MQVDTTTLAEVGTVARRTSTQDPGADFALIEVFGEVAAKWGVNPAIPTGGPQGIYTGCDPGLEFFPGELVGTRTTAILRFLGSGWAQVNADGSTSAASSTACGGSVADGGGSGGGGGGGKGNGKGGGGKPR